MSKTKCCLLSTILLVTLTALIFFKPAGVCAADADIQRSITVDGLDRSYILHIPPSHPATCALVLVLHGGGGRAENMRTVTGMNSVADNNGFVVAYPQGMNTVWNDGGSDLTDNKTPRDDVAFLRALVKDASTQVQIDTKKVFSCGLSNGGSMSSRLALEAHDLIAAAAFVGSGLSTNQAKKFTNPAPIPVLFIEGTSDPCFPYEGGLTTGPNMGGRFAGQHHGTVLSLKDALAFWCAINGCKGAPEIVEIPHLTKDDTSTTVERWQGKNGNDVAAMIVKNGGHCWPGGLQYFPVTAIGKTTYDFNASKAIWRFFANHGGR